MSRGRPSTPTGRAERSARATGAGPVASRRGAASRPSDAGDAWTLPGAPDEADIDPAELREFLAADLLDVQADPVFKERLRMKLWRLVRVRYGDGRDED